MKTFHTVFTVVLGIALFISLVFGQKTRRELQQQLHTLTDANRILRQTLGDMTLAITEKDKEISRLYSPCNPQELGRRKSQALPPSRTTPADHSNIGQIGAE
jgi:hypothetical protein